MKSQYISYDFVKSFERISEILSETENSYEEINEIPARDKLTFTNGFYVNCSALVVDIRNSSDLPEKHKRPKLAKLYRSYISEVVALMNGYQNCAEVNIIGDGICGIFRTPYQNDIDNVFNAAYSTSSLIDVLNYELEKNDIEQINVGIGVSYGRALMIKAGYRGSGINDVVWMGDVVNEAFKLANYGNKTWSDNEIMVSSVFYSNLNEDNKKLMVYNSNRACYHGNIVNSVMNEWFRQNCA